MLVFFSPAEAATYENGSKIAKALAKEFSRPEKISFWRKTVKEYVASEGWRLSIGRSGDL